MHGHVYGSANRAISVPFFPAISGRSKAEKNKWMLPEILRASTQVFHLHTLDPADSQSPGQLAAKQERRMLVSVDQGSAFGCNSFLQAFTGTNLFKVFCISPQQLNLEP